MAARHIDWTHIRVNGDQHAAAPYVGEGRKLLGEVFEEAERNGLGVHYLHKLLNDGTVIVAEKHGDIPRITITPVGGAGKKPIPSIGEFLAWPSAPSEANQPAILRPARDALEDWRSYFYTSDSTGYAEVNEDDRGTYIAVFPQGIASTGFGTSWVNARGEALNIFNIASRYWAQRYYHPYLLYAGRVIHAGRTVLDLGTYRTADDESLQSVCPHILGAGIRDGWLYVVAASLGAITFTAPPGSPADKMAVWTSPQFATGLFNTYLFRFRISAREDPATGILHYVVANGTEQQLAAFSARGLYSPWIFNRDCTEVVSYTLPQDAVMRYRRRHPEGDAPPPEFEGFATEPTLRVAITIDEDGEASLSTTASGDAIAESNGVRLRLVHQGGGQFDYVCGPYAYPAFRFSGTDNVPGNSMTSHEIVDCDIDFHAFAFIETTLTVNDNATTSARVPAFTDAGVTQDFVVWKDGVEVWRKNLQTGATGVAYDHRGTVAASERLRTLGASALSRFFLVVASNVALFTTEEDPDDELVIARLGGNHQNPLRRIGMNPPTIAGRYSMTGGMAWASGTPPVWATSYRGYAGALDAYNGTPPGARPVFNGMAANAGRTICYDASRGGYAPAQSYASGRDDDIESLVGSLAIATFSLLGVPPLGQPTEREA